MRQIMGVVSQTLSRKERWNRRRENSHNLKTPAFPPGLSGEIFPYTAALVIMAGE
jgi:hypothetical protein